MTTQLGIVPGGGGTAGRRDRAARAARRAQKPAGPGRAERARHRLRARGPGRPMRRRRSSGALDENPSNVQALENIGTLEMQRGNLPAAQQRAASRRSAIDPRSARAHNGLGVVAMKTGAADEAFAHWKRAVELAPNDFDALFNLATELDAAGRRDEARPFLERFVARGPAGAVRARHRQGAESCSSDEEGRAPTVITKVTKATKITKTLRDLGGLGDLCDGAWAVCRGARSTARRRDGPIILISIDTLRADHLPAYGYTEGPHAEHRCARGGRDVLFEHAYSHAPQTLPAHTSILSGQLPFEHGVRDNVGFTRQARAVVRAAARCSERGWPTGGFVSAYVLRAATGINQGFDTYDSELPPASGERVDRAGAARRRRRRWPRRRRGSTRAIARSRSSSSSTSTSRTSPTRRRRASRRTSPTTARSPTPTRSSAGCSIACARWTSTTARRSSCSPITAKGSAITASRSTGCSSTARRRTCRSS